MTVFLRYLRLRFLPRLSGLVAIFPCLQLFRTDHWVRGAVDICQTLVKIHANAEYFSSQPLQSFIYYSMAFCLGSLGRQEHPGTGPRPPCAGPTRPRRRGSPASGPPTPRRQGHGRPARIRETTLTSTSMSEWFIVF